MKKLTWTLVLQIFLAAGSYVAAQSPLKGRDSTINGPQTFAIVMGISKYKYVRPLAYADKDAQLFKDYQKSPGGGSIQDDNIFTLLNDKAINSNFWGKGFQWLKAKRLQKGDKLFIYLAGHGDAIDEDQFFFLGYDCNPQGDKNNYLVAGTIQLYNLKKKIVNETAKGVDVFFIMDACRSNELPGGQEGQNFLNSAISEKKAGEIIMLATGAGQESLEDVSIGNGHGLFTYYLVDGLNGLADTIGGADKKVTFREIQAYVDKNVPFVAEQRFKRKQDPYFCCTENSDKVISTVDEAYLQKWLKQKKQQNQGGGNSFSGYINKNIKQQTADTALVETYNRFNAAVKANKLSGPSSAEEYFGQLNKKFPGNPYTLDAKSTLAVEYINAAQAKVDRYLGCGDDGSAKERQDNYETALNLEKAIAGVRDDDEDFANSLLNRMYFLKACGDFGKDGMNGDISIAFQNAFAALRIDPNGAYIQNKLALLHLQNGNKDSALFYASKAVKTAPNWPCAVSTLALVQKANQPTDNNLPSKSKPKPGLPHRNSFGITFGAGINKPNPSFAGSRTTNITEVSSQNGSTFDIGFIFQSGIGRNLFIRPAIHFISDKSDVLFISNPITGGATTQAVAFNNLSVNASLPFVIRFTNKTIAPFISLGPTFSYLLKQNAEQILPFKKSILSGDAGLGLDINILKAGIVLSPEIKFTEGFTDMNAGAGTSYADVLSSLKRKAFTFNVYLRRR